MAKDTTPLPPATPETLLSLRHLLLQTLTTTTSTTSSLSNASIKSNKLRKLLLEKKLKNLGITWDDFQRVVDDLVEEDLISVKEVKDKSNSEDNGIFLSLVDSNGKKKKEKEKGAEESNDSQGTKPNVPLRLSPVGTSLPTLKTKWKLPDGTYSDVDPDADSPIPPPVRITIPVLIGLHLQRNKSIKLKKIEENTKCRLNISGSLSDKSTTCTLVVTVQQDRGAAGERRIAAVKNFLAVYEKALAKNRSHFDEDYKGSEGEVVVGKGVVWREGGHGGRGVGDKPVGKYDKKKGKEDKKGKEKGKVVDGKEEEKKEIWMGNDPNKSEAFNAKRRALFEAKVGSKKTEDAEVVGREGEGEKEEGEKKKKKSRKFY